MFLERSENNSIINTKYPMLILVTGGTGLLGAHLLYKLCKEHEKVRAIKRSTSSLDTVKHIFSYYTDTHETLFNKIEWLDCDILDITDLDRVFDDVTHVYHCAAMVSFDSRDRERLYETNVNGTANIVNICLDRGIEKLCHVSSVAALGRSENQSAIKEDAHWKDDKYNSQYAVSKYQAEMEVWRAIEEGLNAVIVNPSVILGPGKWDEGSSGLFGKIYNGFKFYTEGENAFVDVKDVVDIMKQLMSSSLHAERYIICAENLSYKNLFFTIADALQKPRPSIKPPAWLSSMLWRLEKIRTFLFNGNPFITRETAHTALNSYHYDNEKIKTALNYSFIPIEQSIKENAALYITDLK